jgi:hypothetical protein
MNTLPRRECRNGKKDLARTHLTRRVGLPWVMFVVCLLLLPVTP